MAPTSENRTSNSAWGTHAPVRCWGCLRGLCARDAEAGPACSVGRSAHECVGAQAGVRLLMDVLQQGGVGAYVGEPLDELVRGASTRDRLVQRPSRHLSEARGAHGRCGGRRESRRCEL